MVSNEKLRMVEKGGKFEVILNDRQRMGYWGSYCDWSQGKTINLLTKLGSITEMTIKIEDYHLYKIGQYFRTLIIQRTKDLIFDDISICKDRFKLEDKSLKKIFEYIRRDVIDAENYLRKAEEIEGIIREGGDNWSDKGKSARHMRVFRSKTLKDNVQATRSPKKKTLMSIKSIQHPHFLMDSGRKQGRVSKFYNKYDYIKEESQSDENSFEENQVYSDFMSSPDGQKVRRKRVSGQVTKSKTKTKSKEDKIGILNLKKIHNAQDLNSSGSSIQASVLRSNRIEKIYKKYYKPEKKRAMHFITSTVIVLLILSYLASLLLRRPVEELAIGDIKAEMVTVDMFSWEVYANLYSVFWTDVCRGTKEGWFDDNTPMEDFGVTFNHICHLNKDTSVDYIFLPDNEIDKRIREMNLKWMFPYEQWATMEVSVPVYKEKDGRIEWSESKYHRRSSIKMLQNLGYTVGRRDYQNDSSLPILGSINNRDLDPEEELYRRMNLGDINYQYALKSYEFYEYIKKIALVNKLFLAYNIFLPCLFTLVVYIFYSIYLFSEVKSMETFYKTLLSIKVLSPLNFFLGPRSQKRH